MPRKARIDHAGLSHHIMARTFNDLLLFRDDADRSYYLSCLVRRIKETGFLCYAWVLMDTHVHLLIRTTELPLWKLMKPLGGDYARYYNKKYNRRGPLFCDRYKSIATQDQYYLEQLVRYIHLNPIRAKVCTTIRQLDSYQWCGHRAIVRGDGSGFQEVKQVLCRFGKNRGKAREKYRDFIKAGFVENSRNQLFESIRANNAGSGGKNNADRWVIGDTAFQKSVLAKDAANRLVLARYQKEGVTLADVLEGTANKTKVKKELLLTRSKRSPHNDARMVFCHFATSLGFPSRATGQFLSIGQAAVSHAARKGKVIADQLKIGWE